MKGDWANFSKLLGNELSTADDIRKWGLWSTTSVMPLWADVMFSGSSSVPAAYLLCPPSLVPRVLVFASSCAVCKGANRRFCCVFRLFRKIRSLCYLCIHVISISPRWLIPLSYLSYSFLSFSPFLFPYCFLFSFFYFSLSLFLSQIVKRRHAGPGSPETAADARDQWRAGVCAQLAHQHAHGHGSPGGCHHLLVRHAAHSPQATLWPHHAVHRGAGKEPAEGEGVGEASSFPSTVPYLRRQVPYLALYLTFFWIHFFSERKVCEVWNFARFYTNQTF